MLILLMASAISYLAATAPAASGANLIIAAIGVVSVVATYEIARTRIAIRELRLKNARSDNSKAPASGADSDNTTDSSVVGDRPAEHLPDQ